LQLHLCLVAQCKARLGVRARIFLRLEFHAREVEAVARYTILVDVLVGWPTTQQTHLGQHVLEAVSRTQRVGGKLLRRAFWLRVRAALIIG
jgi:hypothetical protein